MPLFFKAQCKWNPHPGVIVASYSWPGNSFCVLGVCFGFLFRILVSSLSLPEHLDLFLRIVYCPRFSYLKIVLEWFFVGGMILWFLVFCQEQLLKWAWPWLCTERKSPHAGLFPTYPHGSFPLHLCLKLLGIYCSIISYAFCDRVWFLDWTYFTEKLERYGRW